MLYEIVKNSVSTYPNPVINCTVNCFLTEQDKSDNNPCYWIPYQIALTDCIGFTQDQIDEKVRTEGELRFNTPEMQPIFAAIELGVNINAPEVVV